MRTQRRVQIRLVTGVAASLLAIAGATVGSSLPALAAPPAGKAVSTYVALGDSYAAGQGGEGSLGACGRTASGYPSVLDADHAYKLLRDVSCAGVETAGLRATQLTALNPGVKVVTVTVGGNDLRFESLGSACTEGFGSDACLAAVARAADLLPALGPQLVETYSAIAAAAPRATIVVTGYPALVAETAILDATTALNDTIRDAVAAVRARGADIRFADVMTPFLGHGIGSAQPWIVAAGPDALHPTTEGYRAFARAIAAVL
jgi:lysophospholipase L1-like esterase